MPKKEDEESARTAQTPPQEAGLFPKRDDQSF